MKKYNCNLCYNYWHEEKQSCVSSCNCCENGGFFTPIDYKRGPICPNCGNRNFKYSDSEGFTDEGELAIIRHCHCNCGNDFSLVFRLEEYKM